MQIALPHYILAQYHIYLDQALTSAVRDIITTVMIQISVCQVIDPLDEHQNSGLTTPFLHSKSGML